MAASVVAAIWKRDVLHTFRNPAVMISALFIPAVFFLAFYAAFSHPAEAFGVHYVDYLLPTGIIQAIIFTAGGSALAIAEDAEDGFHQRLLSMPIDPWTIVAGRMLADLTRTAWSGCIIAGVAVAMGARVHHTLLLILIMAVTAIAFCAAVDGVCLVTAKPTSSALTFQGLVIVVLMFSTAFVPASALPSAAAAVVRHVPITPILEISRHVADSNYAVSNGTIAEGAIWLVVLCALGTWGFTRSLRRGSHV